MSFYKGGPVRLEDPCLGARLRVARRELRLRLSLTRWKGSSSHGQSGCKRHDSPVERSGGSVHHHGYADNSRAT